MVNKFLLFILLICPGFAISQTLEMVIQDDNGNTVYNSSIFINNSLIPTNNEQPLFLKVNSNDKITIYHKRYEGLSFEIPDQIKSTDTIKKIVLLEPHYQEFNEVVISSSKYQNVFKNKNEVIVDYYPFPTDKFFLITQFKRKFFLKVINEYGKVQNTYQLNFKPQKLFLEALGHFFIVSKDSAYQIYIKDKSLNLMSPISKYDFEYQLKNLVALNDKGAFYQKYSMHNQLFTLSKVKDGSVDNCYRSFDKEQYKTALHNYKKVINFYMAITPEKDNIISMGIWDGDLMTLNTALNLDSNEPPTSHTGKIIEMIGWSEKIASKPINVKSYGMSNAIVILDGLKDSLILLNNKSIIKREVKANFTLSGTYFQDFFYDNIYMLTDEKDGLTVYKINYNDGKLKEINQFTGIQYPQNVKLIDDKVYFLALDENGFNRIVRVRE